MPTREPPPSEDLTLDGAPLEHPDSDDEPGDTGPARSAVLERQLTRGDEVGRYVILERIGAGGMGVVYAAWDPKLDRKVALKLLHGDKTEHGQRLEREAQAMARLAHPNVITVHDVGEVDGRVFVAMEFIDGQTLGAWAGIATRDPARPEPAGVPEPRDWSEILEVMLAAGRGLAAAHAQSLVHRDFKPDNVMVGVDGRVFVMDFGLVRAARSAAGDTAQTSEDRASDSTLLARARLSEALSQSSALESDLTRAGALIGTPAYMAPEQLRGDEADARSDQFAFCLVTWQCLYGARPFAGDTPLAVLFSVSQAKFSEPPPGRSVPTQIRRALERGLAADPEDRWPNMSALLDALTDDPSARRRPWILGGASLALAAAAAVAAILLQPPPAPSPCAEVGASMTETWSEARAAEIGQTFARSELRYAEDTWGRTVPLLDDWSSRWIAARRDACEDTQIRHEQSPELLDLRMACLDERARHFAALVEVFAAADDTVIDKAIEAAEALPPLEICGDRSWLTAAVRPPEDPEIASAVASLRDRVAKIEALTDGGKAQSALGDADTVLRDAQALGWQPAIAEAAIALGRARQEAGEFAGARDALETAFFAARRGNHDEVTIRASFLLDYALSVGLGDFGAARAWSEHGLAEAERVGRGDLLSQVYAGIGIRNYLSTDMARAEVAFRKSLELAPAGRSIELASAHINYGTVLIHVDPSERKRAFDHLDRGLEMLEQRVGPNHPKLALALSNYATVHGHLDEQAQAIALLERAREINERALGSKHPMTALFELNLATNLLDLDEHEHHEKAAELASRSLATHIELFGDAHVMVAQSRFALALALLRLEKPADAIDELDAAAAIWTEKFGPTNIEVVSTREVRARCELALGQREQAVATLESILAVEIDDPSTLATVKLTLAEALVDVDQDRARALLDEVAELSGDSSSRHLTELRQRLDADRKIGEP